MTFSKLLRKVDFLFFPQIALAHCDIPCGIYDPKPAQIYAAGVAKMVEKIVNPPAIDESDAASRINFHNNMTRFVIVKEQQAQKCKDELFILWADYFKAEHLEMFPNLHEKFWNAVKLCSKNKQEVSTELANNLIKAVDEIAEMFAKSKAAAK